MSGVAEPDWRALEARIINEATAVIERFAKQHPVEVCSCFAFAVDCCYGDVVLCIDSFENSLAKAKALQRATLKHWDSYLGSERGWQNAEYEITSKKLYEYNPYPVDEFKYGSISILHFDDWETYFLCEERNDDEPDPIGHVIVLMHNVVDRLTSLGVFEQLKLSAPFRVGVHFADISQEEFIVMRILNWPDAR